MDQTIVRLKLSPEDVEYGDIIEQHPRLNFSKQEVSSEHNKANDKRTIERKSISAIREFNKTTNRIMNNRERIKLRRLIDHSWLLLLLIAAAAATTGSCSTSGAKSDSSETHTQETGEEITQQQQQVTRQTTNININNNNAGAKSSFCQAQTVGYRLQGQQSQDWTKKVFCFYDIQDEFRPQDLNPCLCTHVVYSYVAVRKNLSFIAGKKGDLRSLASLKRKNPNLKLLVSLRPDDYFSFDVTSAAAGLMNTAAAAAAAEQQQVNETAGNMQQPAASNNSNSNNAATSIQMNEMHQKFAKRIRDFIVRHSLDGINIDWPYFAQTMSSTNASRDHLTLVLAAINENFQTTLAQSSPSSAYLRLQSPIVTMTASKDFYSIVDGYDFHQINKLLDYVHLPAFDFDLNVDQYSIGHPARLHGISDAENLDTLVDLLLSSGLPSEQLIAGIPSHGVQITSRPNVGATSGGTGTNSNNNNLDEQLEAAANISIISHSEVCRIRDLVRTNCSTPNTQQANGTTSQTTGGAADQRTTSCWTVSRARDLTAPFAYDSEHWIGFDDETSVKLKAKYVLLRHLAGVSMFTVNNDDPAGVCGFGPYPLLATVNGVFSRAPIINHPQQQLMSTTQQATNQRTYFTRAPNQLLTATSLMSSIFGKKLASSGSSLNQQQQQQQQQQTTPTPSLVTNGGDLMTSASDQRDEQVSATGGASGLMSFVDIIEKYGAVNRLDANGAQSSRSTGSQYNNNNDQEQGGDSESIDRQLPCNKVGYQRYPRDCSRFYRCVQTPPATVPVNTPSMNYNNNNNSSSSTQPIQMQTAQVATSLTTRLQYECPSGLVFDEQYQICNWPSWSAQCTGSGEVNSITNSKFVCPNYGYFQNLENCEYFYYCSDYNRGSTQSQAYQFRCPFELGFDEEKLQCNWKWLVKGCNVTSAAAAAVGGGQNPHKSELAQKYLQSLNKLSNSQNEASSETTVTTSTLSPEPVRRKRSTDDGLESRSSATEMINHVNSLIDSIIAVRDYKMKKSGEIMGKPSSSVQKLTGSGGGESTGNTKYPSFVGSPQTTSSPTQQKGTTGFRVRRRQANVASESSSSSSSSSPSSSSSSGGLLYPQRPPPPSMFPFLPSSALYMVADTLRSFGEVIQGEFNRYLRVAGDRMRRVFGLRGGATRPQETRRKSGETGSLATSADVAQQNDKLDAQLAEMEAELSEVDRRKKRTKRDLNGFSDTGDLQALESGQSPQAAVYLPPPPGVHMQPQQYHQHHHHNQQQQQQQHYVSHHDPLGRPPGYPLNPLDEAAKSAVLGPEPQLYSQPSHLVSNQISGITQQEYERLMNLNRNKQQQQPNQYVQHNTGNGYRVVQQETRHHQAQLQQANNNNYLNVAQHAQNYHHQQAADSAQMMMAASASGIIKQVVPAPAEMFNNNRMINRGEAFNGAGNIGSASSNMQQQQLQQAQQQQDFMVPYGMPAPVRPLIQQQQQQVTMKQQPEVNESKKNRRTTVAMKLANFALPKFVTRAPNYVNQQTTKATTTGTGSTKGYRSFLPNLSNVVTAPARNIMNKAMDINKAVHDLISTLSPGSGGNKANNGGSAEDSKQQAKIVNTNTTPMPTIPMVQKNFAQIKQQHQFLQQQQQQQQVPMKTAENHVQSYKVQNPQQIAQTTVQMSNMNSAAQMLLTEEEARALSAQLDQLTKEQLESLSVGLFPNQEQQPPKQLPAALQQQQLHHQPQQVQMQPQQQQQQQQKPIVPQNNELSVNTQAQRGQNDQSQDYVTKLLKFLSQTSHNPEDVKLLDQLASQLNNPQSTGQNGDPLVELGQPDDIALLESLGLTPNGANRPNTNVEHNNNQPQNQQNQHSKNTYTVETSTMPTRKDIPGVTVYPEHVGAFSNNEYQVHGEGEGEEGGKTNVFMQKGSMKPLLNMHTTEYTQPPEYDLMEDKYQQTPRVQSYMMEPTPKPVEPYVNWQPYNTAPVQQSTYYPTTSTSTTTTTTTTTTTRRPLRKITQTIEEQLVQRPAPPIKQVFTELIESNVTTPDGIETTYETRTKSAVSAGAGFSIASQVGLGMVPRPFSGSIPPSSSFMSSSSSSNKQTIGSTETNPIQQGAGVKGGPSGEAGGQKQQQFNDNNNNFHSYESETSEQQQNLGQQQVFETSYSSPATSGSIGQTSLNNYNFATQPVSQYEEVVVRKKFKPFPKQVIVPQTTQYTFEEVRSETPPQQSTSEVINEQSDNFSSERFQQQSLNEQQLAPNQNQQQQQQQDISTSTVSSSSSFGGDSNSQQKLDQTIESSFSEQNSAAGSKDSSFSQIVDQPQQQQQQQIVEGQTVLSDSSSTATTNGQQLAGNLAAFEQVTSPNLSFQSQELRLKSADDQTTPAYLLALDSSSSNTASSGSVPEVVELAAQAQRQRKKTKARARKRTTTTTSTTENPPSSSTAETKPPIISNESKDNEQMTTTTRRRQQQSKDQEPTFGSFVVELKRSQKPRPEVAQLLNGGEYKAEVVDQTTTQQAPTTTTTFRPSQQHESLLLADRKKMKGRRSRSKIGSTESRRLVEATSTLPIIGSESIGQTVAEGVTVVKATSSGDRLFGQPLAHQVKDQAKNSSRSTAQGGRKKSKRKGSKNLKNRTSSASTNNNELTTSGSSMRQQQSTRSNSFDQNRALSATRPVAVTHEQVAIYGTKSGFMPIIKPDDPNYHTTTTTTMAFDDMSKQHQQVIGNSLVSGANNHDPLNIGESFVSSKHQAPDEIAQQQQQKRLVHHHQQKDVSWKNFVRALNDQISVVNLGNYSTENNNAGKQQQQTLHQVKLVILPALPNSHLLDSSNWQHLSSNYPRLFPQNMAQLHIEAINLGEASIRSGGATAAGGGGGSIDSDQETRRLEEFGRQYEPISRLIERRTFKALDEIVQRSDGRLFMMQRSDDGSRTIIAVIPNISNKLPINLNNNRQQAQQPDRFMRPMAQDKNRYQLSISTQQPVTTKISTPKQTLETTTSLPQTTPVTTVTITTTTSSTTPPSSYQSNPSFAPRRAAAFSRAIQESIQGAIRQHYDSMKNKLKQSLTSESPEVQKLPVEEQTTTTIAPQPKQMDQLLAWSTPPSESLASMESGYMVSNADPMETSGSSTEYSISRVNNNNETLVENTTTSMPSTSTSTQTPEFASRAVYEVDGAEPKALYGLELNSQQVDQNVYFASNKSSSSSKPVESSDVIISNQSPTETVTRSPEFNQRQQRFSTPSSRFISIGSHLIASPMKLPKVVDQAYVNHFYDHISDNQLAKAAGFDEILNTQTTDQSQRNKQSSSMDQELTTTTMQPQTITSGLGEDSLVPESACTRAGLFQHPFACNKFYECFWDKQLNKYTLHMFECPIKLAFDDRIVGCAMPIESSLCVNY